MATHFRRRLLALKVVVALGAVAGAGLLDADRASVARQPAPWCAYQGGVGGGYDCSFYSFEQCMETARGLGNFCAPNPRVVQYPDRPERRVRR
jgi:hypothetical protein